MTKNRASHHRPSHKLSWPLRKVVEVVDVTPSGCPIERLECGHAQRARSDYAGPTNAYRRRCRECGRARATCPVCEGRGYFFDPRGKYLYCDCEANKRDGGVASRSDCFLHGPFVGVFCGKCEREAGR